MTEVMTQKTDLQKLDNSIASPPLPETGHLDQMNARLMPYLENLGKSADAAEKPRTYQNNIRKLHNLMSLLGQLVELYVFYKQDDHHKKQEKAKTNVINIQGYTSKQGWVHGGGAVLAIVLSFFRLTEVSTQGAAAIDKMIDSWKQGDQFEESLFLQLSSSERQALEGIKNLPQSLQQLILKLLEMEKEAISLSRQR